MQKIVPSIDDRTLDLVISSKEAQSALEVFKLAFKCGLIPDEINSWINFKQDLFNYTLRHSGNYVARGRMYGGVIKF